MIYNECVYFKMKDVTLRLNKNQLYYPIYEYYCGCGKDLVKIDYPLITCNKCINFRKANYNKNIT